MEETFQSHMDSGDDSPGGLADNEEVYEAIMQKKMK